MPRPELSLSTLAGQAPAELDAYWMPFTANRQFKAAPRLLVRAEGMYYHDVDDRPILDGAAGLWCCNAGHARPRIVQAIQQQAAVAQLGEVAADLRLAVAERAHQLADAELAQVGDQKGGASAGLVGQALEDIGWGDHGESLDIRKCEYTDFHM